MSAEPRHEVRVKPYSYQPSKAELEEDVSTARPNCRVATFITMTLLHEHR